MSPAHIGRYSVLRELGAGSFGTVWLCEGQVPRRGGRSSRRQQVAIKQLSGEWTLERFETLVLEFELLERVKHRSLCRVHEFLDRENAVVMDYVEGVTLRVVLERLAAEGRAVPVDAALEIGAEIADCLYQAHATPGPTGQPLGLVHRDLKPENLMLTPSGEVKVLDFGLAQRGDARRDAGVMGTPLYMAPEQALGGELDHRTDLFAVGLVVLELMTGRAVYPVPSRDRESVIAALLERIDRAEVQDDLMRVDRIAPRCVPVLERCLRRRPADRPADGHALMLDLLRVVERRGALSSFAGEVFAAPRSEQGDFTGRRVPGMIDGSKEGSDITMAKNPDPVRPVGPPPPGASSRPRPPPAARPPPKPAVGGKMWSPPPKEASVTATDAARPAAENLRMVPLTDDDHGMEPNGSGSSTSFFSLPAPKRPVGGDPDEPIQSLRRHDPVAAASAPQAPAPAGPPPGAYPGMMPMGGMPMTPMQAMPQAAPMVPLGIQGPVANGMYGAAPAHSAQLPPDLQQDVQRAQSYRVFALVTGLMFMVLSVVIVTVLLTVGAVLYSNKEETATGNMPVIAAPPPVAPPPVDTGGVREPPPLPPKPVRPTRPTPTAGTPTPRPTTPKPPPEPVVNNDPAQVTITLAPGSPPFTAIEVVCPATGFRQRGGFEGPVASVAGVPRVDCDVHFKGGPPVKSKISGGQSKTCSFQGVTAICN